MDEEPCSVCGAENSKKELLRKELAFGMCSYAKHCENLFSCLGSCRSTIELRPRPAANISEMKGRREREYRRAHRGRLTVALR